MLSPILQSSITTVASVSSHSVIAGDSVRMRALLQDSTNALSQGEPGSLELVVIPETGTGPDVPW